MQYLNPFHLFDLSADAVPSGEALRKLRRRLLAEFELEGGVTLEWKGIVLDRSGVLDQLAELEDPKRGEYHRRVASDPAMLQFLIGGATEAYPATPASEDQGFQSFLVPYIGTAWANWLLAVLKSGNSDRMQWGMHRASELVGKAREDSLKLCLAWISARVERMDAWDRTQPHAAEDAKDLLDLPPSHMHFLADLPDRHLALRNRFASSYVTLLIQAARNGFYSFNAMKRKLDDMIVGLRLTSDLEPHLRLRVEAAFSMFAAFEQSQKMYDRIKDIRSVPPPGKPVRKGWFHLAIILFLAILIALLSKSNRSTDLSYIPRYHPNFSAPILPPSSYTLDYEGVSRQLDSILSSLDSTLYSIKMPEFEDVLSDVPKEKEDVGQIREDRLPYFDSIIKGLEVEKLKAIGDSSL
jgi:hypothetical protein